MDEDRTQNCSGAWALLFILPGPHPSSLPVRPRCESHHHPSRGLLDRDASVTAPGPGSTRESLCSVPCLLPRPQTTPQFSPRDSIFSTDVYYLPTIICKSLRSPAISPTMLSAGPGSHIQVTDTHAHTVTESADAEPEWRKTRLSLERPYKDDSSTLR